MNKFVSMLFNLRHEGHSEKPIAIAPSGQASRTEPCHICNRLPRVDEEGFMIYGLPICEDCFWDRMIDAKS